VARDNQNATDASTVIVKELITCRKENVMNHADINPADEEKRRLPSSYVIKIVRIDSNTLNNLPTMYNQITGIFAGDRFKKDCEPHIIAL
jgi:hypothetical protein